MTLASPGSTLFAGRFADVVVAASAAGEPLPTSPVPSEVVTVYDSDGTTLASLYTDQARSSAAPNPTTTDDWGNLEFYADPGPYVLSFALSGIATTLKVVVDPWYSDGAWNVVVVSADYAANGGDCVLADASAGPVTVTVPWPAFGAQVRVVKTDSSANAVTLTTPGQATYIQGPGGFLVRNLALSQPGGYVETVSGDNSEAALFVYVLGGPFLGAGQGVAVGYNGGVEIGLAGAVNVNVVAASGSALTLADPATAIGNYVTLSADCTVTMPPAARGAFCYIRAQQAASGGPFGVVFNGVQWPGGLAPVMSTGPGAVDRYDFLYVDGAWFGTITGQNYS